MYLIEYALLSAAPLTDNTLAGYHLPSVYFARQSSPAFRLCVGADDEEGAGAEVSAVGLAEDDEEAD